MSTAKKKRKGVTYYDPSKAYEGYTLFAPEGGHNAWLIDMEGHIVHHWPLTYKPCMFCRLLPNGHLLYVGREEKNPQGPKQDLFDIHHNKIGSIWMGGCQHVIEVDWDNKRVWQYNNPLLNHDFYRVENGNTMFMKFVRVPDDLKHKVKGGLPTEPTTPMWCDALIEVNPKGEIIWEWLAYEHLNPEIDILGPLDFRTEWTHMNSCFVLPNGDILCSIRLLNTVCIIDKKKRSIKWRWGRGELANPHDATMVNNGNILVFDNGEHRLFSRFNYSRVVEINPKTNRITWEYKEDPPFAFFSANLGGAQRLPNGNTLITDSEAGRIFEVTYDGEMVWEYISPFYGPYVNWSLNSWIYRAHRFGTNHSALKGKVLDPGKFRWFNAIYGPRAFENERASLLKKDATKSTRRILQNVTVNMTWKAHNGFTLFTPLSAKVTMLVDMRGNTVHKWDMPYSPALYGDLLHNGNLLYSGHVENGPLSDLEGAGGELLEVDWDSNLVWSYKDPYLHHAFYRMANGNTVVLRWVKVPQNIAVRVKGGIPGTEKNGVMWGDCFQEINQQGEVVWEWLSYEHLDPEIDNICSLCPRDEWTQASSFIVLRNGDILTSFRRTHTTCIIDRTTGNVKWRWGRGELTHQTGVTMLENGHMLVFDCGMHGNGIRYPFSRALEIDPTTNAMVWDYRDKDNADINFFSAFMSNCERLPNGNTLICEASAGRIFEVNEDGQIVWEFVNPLYSSDPVYGHNNVVPRAHRYGPEYEGLPEQPATLRKSRRVVQQTRQDLGQKETRVQSRLAKLGY